MWETSRGLGGTHRGTEAQRKAGVSPPSLNVRKKSTGGTHFIITDYDAGVSKALGVQ